MARSRHDRALDLLREQRLASRTAAAITDVVLGHQATQAGLTAGKLRSGHPQILHDPVGTGKTAVALTAARLLLDDDIVSYLLLVAPNKGVAGQWYERAEVPFGTRRRRDAGKWQRGVLNIATHDTVPGHPSPDPTRTLVIVDEAHRGLQHRTEVYDQLRIAAAGAKLLLVSATPFQLSTEGLTSMLGLGTGIDQRDTDALGNYGKSLTAVLRAFDNNPRLTCDDPAVARAAQLKDTAACALGKYLIHQTDMEIPSPPQLELTLVQLGGWAAGYHVARVLPELVGAGKNDSFQRGLVSSSETVWQNHAMRKRVAELRQNANPKLRRFLDQLEEQLGSGKDHPKVAATTDWVRAQVHADHHVIVFTVWKETQRALRAALTDALADDTVTGPVTGGIPERFLCRIKRPPNGSPVVLVLTDRFSESIDLDGGRPSLVHHDLSWNPVRLTQRWGRVVRVRTGFDPIPPEQIFIPVLDTEGDRRLARTVRGRMNLVDLMVPAMGGDGPWQLPDDLLRKIAAVPALGRSGLTAECHQVG